MMNERRYITLYPPTGYARSATKKKVQKKTNFVDSARKLFVLMALLIFKCSLEQKVQNEVQYSINCLAVIVILCRLCLMI